jgi:hypothetical protein
VANCSAKKENIPKERRCGHLRGTYDGREKTSCHANAMRPEGRDEKGRVPVAASRSGPASRSLPTSGNILSFSKLAQTSPNAMHPHTRREVPLPGLSSSASRFLFHPYPCHSFPAMSQSRDRIRECSHVVGVCPMFEKEKMPPTPEIRGHVNTALSPNRLAPSYTAAAGYRR